MNELDKYKLIIFDADGTLINRDTGDWLPGVLPWINKNFNRHYFAVATNQAGPACRDAGWGDKYPTLSQVEDKYLKLGVRLQAKVFMSLCYPTAGGLIVPHGLSSGDPRTSRKWRKPEPGMLVAAMAHYGSAPRETLMVGDRPEDYQAAQFAGVDFRWAYQFFGRGEDV